MALQWRSKRLDAAFPKPQETQTPTQPASDAFAEWLRVYLASLKEASGNARSIEIQSPPQKERE